MDVARIDDNLLEQAFQTVRRSRRHHGPHASIWHLSQHWSTLRTQILNKLHAGQYHLSPCQAYFIEGEWISVWDAVDAVVLKAISYVYCARSQSEVFLM